MDGSRPRVSVVIPAYNEAANIGEVLAQTESVCAAAFDDYEVIVVDDCSTDDTAGIVEGTTRRNSRIMLIRNPSRIGCHPSELVGLRAASKEFASFIPADLQIRPAVIPELVAAAAHSDIVVGVRCRRSEGGLRRAAASLYSWVVLRIFGVRLRDIDSATVYRHDLITEITPLVDPTQPFIPVEIALRALQRNKKIGYVDIEHYPRAGGHPSAITSGFLLRFPFRFLRFLLRCWRVRASVDR